MAEPRPNLGSGQDCTAESLTLASFTTECGHGPGVWLIRSCNIMHPELRMKYVISLARMLPWPHTAPDLANTNHLWDSNGFRHHHGSSCFCLPYILARSCSWLQQDHAHCFRHRLDQRFLRPNRDRCTFLGSIHETASMGWRLFRTCRHVFLVSILCMRQSICISMSRA